MKILYLAPTDSFSGGENVTLQIAVQMQRRGHKVAYCSPYGSIEDFVCEQGVPFIGLDRFSLLAVKRAIRAFKPDIVHAMDYRASFYASLLFHNTISHLHNNCPWLDKLCPNTIALWITAHRAKRCICVSQSILDEFCLLNIANKGKFIVLENVISSEEVLKRSKDFVCKRTYDLGFCGRLTKQKNPYSFLEIITCVKKKLPDIKAVMIGDGELREQVEERISSLHLENNVELVGFQKNPFPYIAACKVMVMPSLWEGFGLAAVEGMVLGCPVLASSVGGLPNVVGQESGNLCNGVVEFTNRAYELLITDELMREEQCKCQQRAILFCDVNHYIDKIEQYYEKVIN